MISSNCRGKIQATKTQSNSNLAKGFERIRNTLENIAEKEVRLERK
jgi:hypothetical protein